MDKAGKKYWDEAWNEAVLPIIWDPRKPGLNNYVQKQFHEYFSHAFKFLEPIHGKKLLEIGCARSATLPYFAKEFGFEVTGIDYSEVGCEMAQAILEEEGIKGTVLCEDFFTPSDTLKEQFDVVVSFGVAEHFQDTAGCISAFSRFLKPGGIIITNIPNMVGIVGYIQKVINRPIFDIHVPIDKEALLREHKKLGLKLLNCNYFMSTNFGVCNLNGIPVGKPVWYIKKIIIAMLARLSMVLWLLELKVGKFKANKFMSPYINCIACKE
jgi:2-polyprenyl-3-methyl-5-hydroxy-6-metoxy-1,4-benzoquinol methylase